MPGPWATPWRTSKQAGLWQTRERRPCSGRVIGEALLSLYALGGVWFAWQSGSRGIAHFGFLAAACFVNRSGFSLRKPACHRA